jgi:hypothetical protein
MKYIRTVLLLILCTTLQAYADEVPTIDPQATFTTDEGEETGTSYSGSAPLTVVFHANAENIGAYTPHYEWRFTKEGATQPYLVRYEEETEYTFTLALLAQLFTAFLCQRRDTDTDDFTVVFRHDTQFRVDDSLFNYAKHAFVPRLDGDAARIRSSYCCYVIDGHHASVRIYADTVQQTYVSLSGTDVSQ